MESSAKDILEKIKNDGFSQASKEKERIIKEAKDEANIILENAKKEAKNMLDSSNSELAKLKESANSSIAQAGRDLIIGITSQVNSIFASLLKDAVATSFDAKMLESVISKLVESWSSSKDLNVLLNEQDFSALQSNLKNSLAAKAKSKIEIKPFGGSEKGFKIEEKGGNTHYNFTSDEVAEVLYTYLNPKFTQIMKNASK